MLKSTPIKAVAVTPSDTADLATPSFLYITVAGTLKVTLLGMTDGTSITLAPTADREYPYIVKRVWATGTTATGIIALHD